MDYLIVVHGIRDNDAWAERIAKSAASRTRRTFTYPFNYFSLISFVSPWSRARAARQMQEALLHQIGKLSDDDTLSFVGHSFGTYLILRFVERYHQTYRISSVAFLSSVLHSFVAPRVIGKCRRFCNFAATEDWALLLNNLLPFPSAGLAGRIGCAGYVSTRDNFDAFYAIGHAGWFGSRRDNPDPDWFIAGPLRQFLRGRRPESEVLRPKVSGWIASLLNLYKMILPTFLVASTWLGLQVLSIEADNSAALSIVAESDPSRVLKKSLVGSVST